MEITNQLRKRVKAEAEAVDLIARHRSRGFNGVDWEIVDYGGIALDWGTVRSVREAYEAMDARLQGGITG